MKVIISVVWSETLALDTKIADCPIGPERPTAAGVWRDAI